MKTMEFKIEINGTTSGAFTEMTMPTVTFIGNAADMEAAFSFLFITHPYIMKCAKKAIKELEG